MGNSSRAAGTEQVTGRWTRWPLSFRLRSRLTWIDLAAQVVSLFFFALLGVGLYQQALHPDFPPHHLVYLPQKEELVLFGRLYRPTRVSPEGLRLYVAAEAWKRPEGWRPVTGKLLVTAPPLEAPPVGSQVFVRGKLREPHALKNPGAFNRPRQLAAEGIFRQMHLKDVNRVVFLASDRAPSLAERLRGGIRALLKEMPPETEAVYLSMLLGDQGKVTPDMRRNLSRTGTSHLLVINGMHLGAVATVTYFLVFWLLRRFPRLLLRVNAMKIATVAAAFPVAGYAHLAGGSPSTQRAEIMVLAYLLLMFLGRFRDVWSALAVAAVGILVVSPLLLFSVSFQLSFTAVIGIAYLTPRVLHLGASLFNPGGRSLPSRDRVDRKRLPSLLRSAGRRGYELLAVSLAASLATAPLVAHHFQVVSLFGFLVNLAAVPLVLMMALPLGELAILAQGLSLTPVARILLEIGRVPLELGYGVVNWVAGVPGSGVAVPSPSWLQVGLIYGVVWLLLPLRRSLGTWVGAALGIGVLAATLAWPAWQTGKQGEVTVLDSSTGLDGVLVAPEGRRLAFTAAWDVWPGWEGGALGPLPGYLHWRQFRRLDAVLALNLNPRNAPEVLTLAQQFEIGGVWWRGPRPAEKVIDLMNLLGDAGRPALSLDKMNPPENLGDMSLAYLHWGDGKGVALAVTCQGRQALILPPLKRTVLENLPWPEDRPLAALVAPGEVSEAVVARLKPANLICYGSRAPEAGIIDPSRPTCLTRDGAVTLVLTEGGAFLRQWRP